MPSRWTSWPSMIPTPSSSLRGRAPPPTRASPTTWCAPSPAAEDLADALVTQAHAQQRDAAGEGAHHVVGEARVGGGARPRRDDDGVGIIDGQLVQREGIVALHRHHRAELAELLRQ